MDREKVIKGLNDIGGFVVGRIGFKQARNFMRTIDDTIALLKEQEAVEPVLEQGSMVCGECGHDVIVQRLIDGEVFDEKVLYCPACGRRVKWE